MPERTCLAIVLAAGEGIRMHSQRPKVLHEIAGRPLLAHALDAVRAAGCTSTAVVVGRGADDILVVFGDTPLIRPQTLHSMRAALARGAALVILGFRPRDPTGYGR